MPSAQNPTYDLHILMPVYNDWGATRLLLDSIDACLAKTGITTAVTLVDDGSSLSDASSSALCGTEYTQIAQLEVLRLRRNLGHQRAICIGLCHLEKQQFDTPLLIMDADGEDAPEDISRLMDEYHAQDGRCVVFAARMKRSEGLTFRLGYLAYRWLHRFLTGHRVRVGNFSILPPSAVSALVAVPELWSHYAAAVYQAKLPRCSISTQRAKRLDGATHMNVIDLVVHGLAAISVFSDIVGVRLLLSCGLLAFLTLSGILTVVWIRLFTELAIPGWATYSAGLFATLLLQSLLLAAHFSFFTLSGRNRATFIPSRDYVHFIGGREVVLALPSQTESQE